MRRAQDLGVRVNTVPWVPTRGMSCHENRVSADPTFPLFAIASIGNFPNIPASP